MGPDPFRSSDERAETPLTAAIMAGRWIRTAAVDDESGRRWRANPDPYGRAATGEQGHLEFARRLADHLIGRATGYDGRGYRWYQAHRRRRPGEASADTGYLTGAAGIGAALLHLDAAGQADRPRRVILLPDNPFPPIPMPAVALRRPAG
ncbi:hypothetical protein [Microbispora bryophytorum]|uniref:Uncharacterized protein n=1 Tax=Microbispora bryophytorum subsp. camponoti TaxID=1677852 RepID=A0ABR8L6R0_9ACTN|nr:hypothetical protein [Microbispora camponoti]MBD3145931.1 hypothetical protein [Microbispora camponoti]